MLITRYIARDGARQAKTHAPATEYQRRHPPDGARVRGGIITRPNPRTASWRVVESSFEDLDGLWRLFCDADPAELWVRGRCADPDADRPRRKSSMIDHPSHIVELDIDEAAYSELGLEPAHDAATAHAIWQAMVPVQWQDAGYIYQWSASAGMPWARDAIKLHFLVLVDEGISELPLKRALRQHAGENWGLVPDWHTAIYNTPIYLHAPAFLGGLTDPLDARRSGIRRGPLAPTSALRCDDPAPAPYRHTGSIQRTRTTPYTPPENVPAPIVHRARQWLDARCDRLVDETRPGHGRAPVMQATVAAVHQVGKLIARDEVEEAIVEAARVAAERRGSTVDQAGAEALGIVEWAYGPDGPPAGRQLLDEPPMANEAKVDSDDGPPPTVLPDLPWRGREQGDYQLDSGAALRVVDQPWVSRDDRLLEGLGRRITLLISPTGTGKTTLFGDLIDEVKTVTYTSPRRSLVDDAAAKLGLCHYERDHLGSPDDHHLREATCSNSLHKRPVDVDLLILDEVDQIAHSLVSTTMRDRTERALAAWTEHLAAAGRVVMASATAGHETLALLTALDVDWGEVAIVYNRHRPERQIEVIESANGRNLSTKNGREALLDHVFEALRRRIADRDNVGPIIYASTTRKPPRGLTHLIESRSFLVRTLCITGETNLTPEARAWLADPTGETPKYDLIAYSPTVQSGVSIDCPVSLVAVDGQSGPHTTPDVIMQMIARARQPERIVAWLDTKPVPGLRLNREQVRAQNRALADGPVSMVRSFSGATPSNPRHFDLWCELELIQDLQRDNLRARFPCLLGEQGYRVTAHHLIDTYSQHLYVDMTRAAYDQALGFEAEEVVECDLLDADAAKRLRDRGARSVTERQQMTLYDVAQALGTDAPAAEDVEAELRDGKVAKGKRLARVTCSQGCLQEHLEADVRFARSEFGVATSAWARAAALRAILVAAGIDLSGPMEYSSGEIDAEAMERAARAHSDGEGGPMVKLYKHHHRGGAMQWVNRQLRQLGFAVERVQTTGGTRVYEVTRESYEEAQRWAHAARQAYEDKAEEVRQKNHARRLSDPAERRSSTSAPARSRSSDDAPCPGSTESDSASAPPTPRPPRSEAYFTRMSSRT